MQFLWILVSLAAYAAGLFLMSRMAPLIVSHPFDDVVFMSSSIGEVVGGILAFIGILLPFAVFNGNVFVRILDFILLIGLLLISARAAIRSFRTDKAFRFSRGFVIGFGVLLCAAAVYCLVLIFLPAAS